MPQPLALTNQQALSPEPYGQLDLFASRQRRPLPPVAERIPHVLNYGMGVDSTAILLRWLEMTTAERGFPLEDLIVLAAETGDEFDETRYLVETYVLPRLREHGIRFVELARAGEYERDGYVVLQDTRYPECLDPCPRYV